MNIEYLYQFTSQAKLSWFIFKQDTDSLGNQFNESIHGDLEKIESLKLELKMRRKKFREIEEKMYELRDENKNIMMPYKKAQTDLGKLACDLNSFNEKKILLDMRRKEMKKLEDELKETQLRFEVLFQQHEIQEKQRDQQLRDSELRNFKNRQEMKMRELLLKENTIALHEILCQHLNFFRETLPGNPLLSFSKIGEKTKRIGDGSTIAVFLQKIEEVKDQIQLEHDNIIAKLHHQNKQSA